MATDMICQNPNDRREEERGAYDLRSIYEIYGRPGALISAEVSGDDTNLLFMRCCRTSSEYFIEFGWGS